MIVTCESCKARYKLDDSKVSGRGAKITCPKCRHVFVVYAQAVEHPSSPAWSPPATGAAREAFDEEEPTRIGMTERDDAEEILDLPFVPVGGRDDRRDGVI